MKYIEEIGCGDCFEINNKYYLLTQDFKKNGDRLCMSLEDGFVKWFQSDTIINPIDIFTMDKDNNILAIKERKKADVPNTN